MSRKRPTEASWDSDDDLLQEDISGINAFPRAKKEESDDELDVLDEDALLGSDDEADGHTAAMFQRHNSHQEQAAEHSGKANFSTGNGSNSQASMIQKAPQELHEMVSVADDELGEDAIVLEADTDENSLLDTSQLEDYQDDSSHIDDSMQYSSQDESGMAGFNSTADMTTNLDNTTEITDIPEEETGGGHRQGEGTSSESETDDEEGGRGRFKSERSTIPATITLSQPKSRSDIPDTLEISEEQQATIDQFLTNDKGRRRNQRGGYQRGRGGIGQPPHYQQRSPGGAQRGPYRHPPPQHKGGPPQPYGGPPQHYGAPPSRHHSNLPPHYGQHRPAEPPHGGVHSMEHFDHPSHPDAHHHHDGSVDEPGPGGNGGQHHASQSPHNSEPNLPGSVPSPLPGQTKPRKILFNPHFRGPTPSPETMVTWSHQQGHLVQPQAPQMSNPPSFPPPEPRMPYSMLSSQPPSSYRSPLESGPPVYANPAPSSVSARPDYSHHAPQPYTGPPYPVDSSPAPSYPPHGPPPLLQTPLRQPQTGYHPHQPPAHPYGQFGGHEPLPLHGSAPPRPLMANMPPSIPGHHAGPMGLLTVPTSQNFGQQIPGPQQQYFGSVSGGASFSHQQPPLQHSPSHGHRFPPPHHQQPPHPDIGGGFGGLPTSHNLVGQPIQSRPLIPQQMSKPRQFNQPQSSEQLQRDQPQQARTGTRFPQGPTPRQQLFQRRSRPTPIPQTPNQSNIITIVNAVPQKRTSGDAHDFASPPKMAKVPGSMTIHDRLQQQQPAQAQPLKDRLRPPPKVAKQKPRPVHQEEKAQEKEMANVEEEPMDEETRMLKQKIEQQKRLREQVIKRKEQRRLQQAQQRRQELEKKLAEKGMTVSDIESGGEIDSPQKPGPIPQQHQQQQQMGQRLALSKGPRCPGQGPQQQVQPGQLKRQGPNQGQLRVLSPPGQPPVKMARQTSQPGSRGGHVQGSRGGHGPGMRGGHVQGSRGGHQSRGGQFHRQTSGGSQMGNVGLQSAASGMPNQHSQGQGWGINRQLSNQRQQQSTGRGAMTGRGSMSGRGAMMGRGAVRSLSGGGNNERQVNLGQKNAGFGNPNMGSPPAKRSVIAPGQQKPFANSQGKTVGNFGQNRGGGSGQPPQMFRGQGQVGQDQVEMSRGQGQMGRGQVQMNRGRGQMGRGPGQMGRGQAPVNRSQFPYSPSQAARGQVGRGQVARGRGHLVQRGRGQQLLNIQGHQGQMQAGQGDGSAQRTVLTRNMPGNNLALGSGNPNGQDDPNAGRRIVVGLAQKAATTPPSCMVSIDNLSASTNEQVVNKMCTSIGPVESIQLLQSQKKALVRFKNADHASMFIKKYNRHMVDLSHIMVKMLPG